MEGGGVDEAQWRVGRRAVQPQDLEGIGRAMGRQDDWGRRPSGEPNPILMARPEGFGRARTTSVIGGVESPPTLSGQHGAQKQASGTRTSGRGERARADTPSPILLIPVTNVPSYVPRVSEIA
jgi:hypothetical protein